MPARNADTHQLICSQKSVRNVSSVFLIASLYPVAIGTLLLPSQKSSTNECTTFVMIAIEGPTSRRAQCGVDRHEYASEVETTIEARI